MNKYEFETIATDAASKVASGPQAVFYAGTMFIKCSPIEAAKIETALIDSLKCGVIVSKVGPEYAYDFVK